MLDVFSVDHLFTNEVSLFALLLYQKYNNGDTSLIFFFKWLLNDESDGAVICPDSEQSYEGLAHSIYTGMATLCGKSSLYS